MRRVCQRFWRHSSTCCPRTLFRSGKLEYKSRCWQDSSAILTFLTFSLEFAWKTEGQEERIKTLRTGDVNTYKGVYHQLNLLVRLFVTSILSGLHKSGTGFTRRRRSQNCVAKPTKLQHAVLDTHSPARDILLTTVAEHLLFFVVPESFRFDFTVFVCHYWEKFQKDKHTANQREKAFHASRVQKAKSPPVHCDLVVDLK